jgi:hypothetical protein
MSFGFENFFLILRFVDLQTTELAFMLQFTNKSYSKSAQNSHS